MDLAAGAAADPAEDVAHDEVAHDVAAHLPENVAGHRPEGVATDLTASQAADRVIPGDALVLLVGPAGSGKSTWAGRRFPPLAVLSSDELRAVVSDDPTDQGASADAFRVLHGIAAARLRRGLLTVVDATNLTAPARRPLRALAARWSRPAVAVVFDLPLHLCLARNAQRGPRRVPDEVVRRQYARFEQEKASLRLERYHAIWVLGRADLEPPGAAPTLRHPPPSVDRPG